MSASDHPRDGSSEAQLTIRYPYTIECPGPLYVDALLEFGPTPAVN